MEKKTFAIIGILSVLALIGSFFYVRNIIVSLPLYENILNANEEFDKESIQIVVPLIEMHKLRNGFYPKNLSELEFKGMIIESQLSDIEYAVNDSLTHYNIKLKSYSGKQINLPNSFWKGTGYKRRINNGRERI